MKLALFVASSVLVAGALAEGEKVCPKDYCFRVRCAAPGDCYNRKHMLPGYKYELRPNASHCGCCPMCVQIMGEGYPCIDEKLANGQADKVLARNSACAKGLTCQNRKCSK